MKAPFPYFGGKRRVASQVWEALGDVDNYIEPFAGSLAVLLERPDAHDRKAETVNDADAYLCNFWRALQANPEGLAKLTDWPVNETDLLARHMWLVNGGKARINALEADPEFYDLKVAAWWVWGINAWIGSGWCKGNGPWKVVDGQVVKAGDAGQGVNRQLPHLGNAGRGVNRQLPHLGDAGRGVNRQLPHLGNGHAYSERKRPEHLADYFSELAARLRRVRVCCGDWSRVVTNGACAFGDTVGVFLDPPYLGDVRTADLYTVDNHDIAHEVRDWAIGKGNDPRFRIVLAGYAGEHQDKMPDNWRMMTYTANKAYGTTSAVGSGEGNDANRHNERLWFSPHCLTETGHLFTGVA